MSAITVREFPGIMNLRELEMAEYKIYLVMALYEPFNSKVSF